MRPNESMREKRPFGPNVPTFPPVLAVFVRAVLAFERRRAREQGIEGRGGAVTAIQRCGSALNTNIHFHTLVAEDVFEQWPNGSLRFVPAPAPPTDVVGSNGTLGRKGRFFAAERKHAGETPLWPQRPHFSPRDARKTRPATTRKASGIAESRPLAEGSPTFPRGRP